MRNLVLTSCLSTCLVAGLAADAAAQTGSAKTLTAWGVVGQYGDEPVHTAAFPANTSIQTGGPMNTSLNERLPNRSGYLRSTARATFRLVKGLPALRIYEAAAAFGPSGSRVRVESTSDTTAPLMPSGRAMLVELKDSPGRRFYLQARLRTTTIETATGEVRIDLGNNGTVDWRQSFDNERHIHNLPVTVPSSGTVQAKIEIEYSVNTRGNNFAAGLEARLDVAFEPIPDDIGWVRHYGRDCGPRTELHTWVVDNERYLTSELYRAPANAPTFLAIGFSELDVPFPGTNCRLYVKPRWVFPVRTSSRGDFWLEYIPVPSLPSILLKFQHATLNSSNQLLLTNGAELKSAPHSGPIYQHADVNHILSTGQSLSIGHLGSPALSTSQPFDNLMLINGMCGNGGRSFQPLKEGGVESHHSSFANLVSDYARNEVLRGQQAPRNKHDVLMSCNGRAGWDITGLSRGSQVWDLAWNQARAAKDIARKANKSYAIRALSLVHGEADHIKGTRDYDEKALQLQLDYEREARRLTGSSYRVPMLHSQIASWTRYNSTTSDVVLQQLKVSVENPHHVALVGPKYHLPYLPDGQHLTNEGYRQMGEHYARVYRHVVLEGGTWEPLRPLLVRGFGSFIDITFHVPEPPLVFDTSLVTNPGNFGFEFADGSSSPPTITSVLLLNEDTVRVTLSKTYTGPNPVVRYAYTGIKGNNAGPTSGARGNLRDSDPSRSRHGYKLYNWCVHFVEAVK